jgi:hypothetical protein
LHAVARVDTSTKPDRIAILSFSSQFFLQRQPASICNKIENKRLFASLLRVGMGRCKERTKATYTNDAKEKTRTNKNKTN